MTAELTNALVSQNNTLATMIDRAEDAAELERADRQVTFVADVWDALDYGYKLVELRHRVAKRAAVLADGERNYIAGCRKNDRTLGTARTNLSKLEAMA